MKDTDYTYAVAYIRTLENKMLTAGTLEAILNSESYEDAVKLIHDSGFSKNGSDSDSVDGLIKKELEYAWSEAREVCPEGAPLDVLLYKNDFHNLKTVLKAVITDTAWENLIIKPCITDPQAICDAIKNTDFSELPEFMSEACERAYKIITETHDGQKAEVYADRKCLEEMKKRADKEKNEFLTGWVDLNIVIANMKIAARAVGRSKDFISSAMVKNEDSHYERLTEAALSSFDSVCDAVASIGYPEAAEKLRGTYLCVDRAHTVELPAYTYFVADLIGLEVSDTEGKVYGKLTNVYETGANDVYEVAGGKLMVPALKKVLHEVDIPGGRMVLEANVLREVGLFAD